MTLDELRRVYDEWDREEVDTPVYVLEALAKYLKVNPR